MVKRFGAAALLAGTLLLVAGCGRKAPPAPPPAPVPTVNASMTEVMAPNAQTIWDISSHAFNEKGDGLDPAKLSAKDWAQLEDAGRQIRDRALLLAQAPHVTAVGPGEHIMGEDASHPGVKGTWDAASPQQVQALIDANPALFAERARNLAKSGDRLVKAAPARDVKTLYEVSSNLDEDCDSCHQPFWGTDEPPPYPGAGGK
jgi:hypothetical protein